MEPALAPSARNGGDTGAAQYVEIRHACQAFDMDGKLARMAVPVLDIEDPQDDVLSEHVHTSTTLLAHPLTKALAPKAEALIADWLDTSAERVKLVTALAQANANALQIDIQLNEIVDVTIDALKRITEGKDDPLWSIFLKGRAPSVFKRPILGGQLAAMALWPSALSTSPHKALNDIHAALTPLLPVAEQAEKAVAKAKQDLVEFKTIGRWRSHITKSNEERTSIYSALIAIPQQNKGAKLPSIWADLFFLHDTSRRGASKQKSAEEIGRDIEKARVALEELEKQQAAAITREEAEAKALAEREAKAKELEEIRQQEKEATARRKQLEKELKK